MKQETEISKHQRLPAAFNRDTKLDYERKNSMKKRILVLLLALLTSNLPTVGILHTAAADAGSYSESTSEQTEISIESYTDDKGKVYVSGFSGEVLPDTVILPAEINGNKVTGINNRKTLDNGDESYVPVDLKGIKHLVIGEGVETIRCMFVGTENLETVTLPTSLKSIAGYAFAGAENLYCVNLENVEAVGSFAFQGCKSLKEVNLAYAEKVGMQAFADIEHVKIYGNRLSAAETYAKDNNVFYERLPQAPSNKKQTVIDGNIYYGMEETAMKLYTLGLMKGIGAEEDGKILFDLERTPTRVEAVTMLVRLLGAEEEAANRKKSHPFTDVPAWADGYVSYAYEKGLTNGIADTLFGSDSVIRPEMYLTFMLRALGYTDSGDTPDFSWENPWKLALENKITERDGYYEIFLRKELVDMSYNTLLAKRKNTDRKLYETMISDGVFTEERWNEVQALS